MKPRYESYSLPVRLPTQLWDEIHQRAEAENKRPDAVIREALRIYIRGTQNIAYVPSTTEILEENHASAAEAAIDSATQFLDKGPHTKEEAVKIENRLRKTVPGLDSFWMTWRFVTTKKGLLSDDGEKE